MAHRIPVEGKSDQSTVTEIHVPAANMRQLHGVGRTSYTAKSSIKNFSWRSHRTQFCPVEGGGGGGGHPPAPPSPYAYGLLGGCCQQLGPPNKTMCSTERVIGFETHIQ